MAVPRIKEMSTKIQIEELQKKEQINWWTIKCNIHDMSDDWYSIKVYNDKNLLNKQLWQYIQWKA